MIEFRTGDILTANSEALVNTVNCAGVMGRGIALQFKNAFPENFKAYKAACSRNEVQPGKMLCSKLTRSRTPNTSSIFRRNATGAASAALRISTLA